MRHGVRGGRLHTVWLAGAWINSDLEGLKIKSRKFQFFKDRLNKIKKMDEWLKRKSDKDR